MRPSGKSGLISDDFLSQLQGELQENRETAAELRGGMMNDIHDSHWYVLILIN